jgi:4'-phosphopantetheinyl transferase
VAFLTIPGHRANTMIREFSMVPKFSISGAALLAGNVDVWLLTVPGWPVDVGLDLLDPQERAHWARFRFDEDRRLYAAAHALLRITLSHYTVIDPRDWRFGAGPYGRPELTGALAALGLRFNLSHTRGLAACAVTRNHTIGIDVELLRNSIDFLAIAQTHFTDCECAQIAAAPAALKADVFFSVWTLKEAYLKARGFGLSLPLKSFSVNVVPPSIRPAPDDCAFWYASLAPQEGCYLVAVAAPLLDHDKMPNIVYRKCDDSWFRC